MRVMFPVFLAVLFLVVAIFYLIPGVNHPLVSDNPLGVHVKHAILFVGLMVLSLVWARFSANAAR